MAAEIIELFPKSEEFSLSFKLGIVAGKMELWGQLPYEWKNSVEGIELGKLVQREAEQLLNE